MDINQKLLQDLSIIYHHNLSQEAKDYLYNRGIKRGIVKFNLGFANEDIGIKNIDYPVKIIMASGMFKEGPHDLFNNRIVIPITQGDFIELFTSRAISLSKTPHLHQKGIKIRYALNFDTIREHDTIFITEGPFDCMSLDEWKIPAIGLLGAHRITYEIIQSLQNKRVYICLDSEPNQTGHKATLRLARKLMAYNIPSYLITLPYTDIKVDINGFFLTHLKKDFLNVIKNAEFYNKTTENKKRTVVINSNFDIIRIASHYLQIQPSGSYYKAVCPFHGDTEPSLVLYQATQSFYCFGCNQYGNSISLIKKCEALQGNIITDQEAFEIGKRL